MKTSQIKRSKILHPFLISIFPILILYSQNIGRINTAEEELWLADKENLPIWAGGKLSVDQNIK